MSDAGEGRYDDGRGGDRRWRLLRDAQLGDVSGRAGYLEERARVARELREEEELDDALFHGAFYAWLERHGVRFSEPLGAPPFLVHADLNLLKAGVSALLERAVEEARTRDDGDDW